MDSESEADPPTTLPTGTRHKCSACFKQYNKKEHLVGHMRASYHSVHQPKCVVCQKHCKTFESLREHLTGPLSKANCSRIFAEQGCSLCMKTFDSLASLDEHKEMCRLPPPAPLGMPSTEAEIHVADPYDGDYSKSPKAVAIDCEMVGGGSDWTLDLCARVCLIDEDENLIFHTYVQPEFPVTDYRYEVTGITKEHLRDAMPLSEVQGRLLQILCNGEFTGRIGSDGVLIVYNEEFTGGLGLDGDTARLLVGHDLEHDLACLKINYPVHLLRDTSKYHPLMKTNLVSHSLKYLTRTYLGYDIQSGVHDPLVDCVSAMRLYKRLRSEDHFNKGLGTSIKPQLSHSLLTLGFKGWKAEELESMSPDELFQISKSNYRCWCLDTRHELLM